ncbi:hypothetical protein MHW47_00570 [Streptomyces sp. OfavH-34-F]|uniref:hypothetical protein n=1 Tax=Streptomyces sp. OfavH-34-F TaxID=2917760 RepID=UPI001EF2AF80|nr:hypothetical protein [Streptomyces sp. OfavH-34-F]MCG7522949.1 hypothetical protein [Streptomyces sp. OfavH-34-F]
MSPKRVRFSATTAPPTADPVPSIGPVVFSVPVLVLGTEQEVDLSDLGHPRLVRPLASALIEELGTRGGVRQRTRLQEAVQTVRAFVTFTTAALEGHGELALDDLEPGLLDGFEQALANRYSADSKGARAALLLLLRLLRRIDESHPRQFELEFSHRINSKRTSEESIAAKPLNAYPFPVFEALEAAALAGVGTVRDRILEGETLAEKGHDPQVHGWDRLENICWYLANCGPLTLDHRGIPAITKHGGRAALNSRLYLTPRDMVRFQVLLACQTGLEPEAIRELRATCLVSPARGYVTISYLKRRSPGEQNKSLRVRDGGTLRTPGGVIRLSQRLTQRARDMIGAEELWVLPSGTTGVLAPRFTRTVAVDTVPRRAFLAEHKIDAMKDHDGGGVSLDLRRIRKTFKSRQYLRAGGILPDFVSGHSPGVAARHYADIPAHDEIHDSAVEAGLAEALAVALPPPVVLADDGSRLDDGDEDLPPQAVQDALSGATDVWLSSCTDFFASPYAPKKGAPCPVPPWVCLECPNAVFTTRHLPAVLSVLDTIERQREEFSVPEWQARFGLAHERITTGVLNRFSARQTTTARAIAEAGGPRLALPTSFLEAIK